MEKLYQHHVKQSSISPNRAYAYQFLNDHRHVGAIRDAIQQIERLAAQRLVGVLQTVDDDQLVVGGGRGVDADLRGVRRGVERGGGEGERRDRGGRE